MNFRFKVGDRVKPTKEAKNRYKSLCNKKLFVVVQRRGGKNEQIIVGDLSGIHSDSLFYCTNWLHHSWFEKVEAANAEKTE